MIGKLTEQQIEEILKENVSGHLGCNDGFNSYIYPINYLYDGKYVTCHSQTGFKIQVMRQNTRVCLQVEEVKNHKNWKSAMLHGEYQELDDGQERHDAMKAFVDRRLFVKVTETDILPDDEQEGDEQAEKDRRPTIFRIVPDEKN
ncbi:MAG: pyridoxamine 5'-phosphate oxidase family protein, partial [Ferruginibacter sp.]